MKTINALFVETNGPYFGIDNVVPWDITRDAKTCRNDFPAIAHPPCERWGRYWPGGPSVKDRRKLGDDSGCFAFALWYVRIHGGVIEHPEASHAFKFFGLPIPKRAGEWSEPDKYGGRSCCVEQGHYGHSARKATWLYACKTDFPKLIWGPCEKRSRLDPGFHTKEEAKRARESEDYKPIKRLSKKEMVETPERFKTVLIEIARSAKGIK